MFYSPRSQPQPLYYSTYPTQLQAYAAAYRPSYYYSQPGYGYGSSPRTPNVVVVSSPRPHHHHHRHGHHHRHRCSHHHGHSHGGYYATPGYAYTGY
ncbi:hypothetical protein Moror_9937 [Moniliophthora roreri MCA 2997]|uniref:Uncharacterized protein n=1 Tax=Moniliophthora roreri (strain MCA 2997) TaxID=1381753 RepID=V2WFS6_MONRO|nr:hypothetical protein Moror_9937 [Moniliophthora roreri MCA 2997]